MIGIVVLSKLWPKDAGELGCFQNQEICGKICVKVREFPVIGVNMYHLSPNEIPFNKTLVCRMAEDIEEEGMRMEYVFFLHDEHICGSQLANAVLDITHKKMAYEFVGKYGDRQISFLFSHVKGTSIYDLLEDHLGNIESFKPKDFVEGVEKYRQDVLSKNKVSDVNHARFEILSPLVALDLIKQAETIGSLPHTQEIRSLKREIDKAMDGLDDPIQKFCQTLTKCDDLEAQLKQLRQNANSSSWQDYHDDLRKIAEQMEDQIAMILA